MRAPSECTVRASVGSSIRRPCRRSRSIPRIYTCLARRWRERRRSGGQCPRFRSAGRTARSALPRRTPRKSSTRDPGLLLPRLYRQLLFGWWTANGALHLKNLALLTREPGFPLLAPAYDLVNTEILIPGDQLALLVLGKKARLKRRDWLEFGAYCGLPAKVVAGEIANLVGIAPESLALLERSVLPADARGKYAAGLAARPH